MTAKDLFGRKARDANAEGRRQIAIVEYVRWVAPQCVIFHPANGGWRTKAEAARFKAMGVVAGTPDLVLVLPSGRSAWWEIKVSTGRLSPQQKEFAARLTELCHEWAIIRSVEDARGELARLGIKTKDHNG